MTILRNVLLTTILGSYVFYCLVALFLVPVFVKPLLLEQSGNFIHGELVVEELAFNPFTNSITLSNIELADVNGKKLLSVEKLYVNVDLFPLLNQTVQIKQLNLKNLKLNTLATSSVEESALITQQWLSLSELTIENFSASLSEQKLTLEQIALNKLQSTVEINHQGANSISPFIERIQQVIISTEKNQERTAAEEDNKWLVIIDTLSLAQAKITLVDTSLSPPQTTEINHIAIQLKNIHSDSNEALLLNIEAELLGGLFTLKGKAHPKTLESELTYSLEKIQLNNLNGYVNHFTHLLIEGGELNSSGTIGTLQMALAEEAVGKEFVSESTNEKVSATVKQELNVTFTNNNSLAQLVLRRDDEENPLLQCELISHKDLHYVLSESSLSLSNFLIEKCVIYAVIHKDGSNNFDLVKHLSNEKESSSPQHQTQDKDTGTINININGIYLTDSLLSLKDFSQGQEANITIKNIQGSVTDIKQGDKFISPILFSALVNEHAPLEIKGQGNFVNPDLSLNTNISLKTMGLKSFSPYTLNLSKRPVEKGALSVNLSYRLEDNIIDGENILLIENLTLGRKQDIQSADNLPLGLAVSVLKDNKGNINIDIPVKGDLNDPAFNINKQIWRTLTGLISKAATSPLTALGGLGSMVTQSEPTYEFIFTAGSSELDSTYDKKIAALANSLQKHPELALNIYGHSSEQDLLVLQSQLSPQTQSTTSLGESLQQLQQQRADYFRSRLLALGVRAEQLVLPAQPSAITENQEQQNKLEKSAVSVGLFAR
jgi:hypothetical protein